jgi:competence protein ComFC
VSSVYKISQWMWGGLDWLFPPICGGCNRVGFRWCPDCCKNVKIIPAPVCRTCSMPLSQPGQCEFCKTSKPPFEMMRSWLYFEGPIRHALHQLKYHRNLALGDALAQYFTKFVSTLGWNVDLVIPVPLGKGRMKERGYNQVGLVAMPTAAMQHWHYEPHGLIRTRETRSQVGLSVNERKENVYGAFKANPGVVSGATVLVMDDIATTGATLSACATSLIDAGAKSVYALTIAHAMPQHGWKITEVPFQYLKGGTYGNRS